MVLVLVLAASLLVLAASLLVLAASLLVSAASCCMLADFGTGCYWLSLLWALAEHTPVLVGHTQLLVGQKKTLAGKFFYWQDHVFLPGHR